MVMEYIGVGYLLSVFPNTRVSRKRFLPKHGVDSQHFCNRKV